MPSTPKADSSHYFANRADFLRFLAKVITTPGTKEEPDAQVPQSNRDDASALLRMAEDMDTSRDYHHIDPNWDPDLVDKVAMFEAIEGVQLDTDTVSRLHKERAACQHRLSA
jgi:hypothetical protein